MRSGKFQSGCRAVTGDVKRLRGGYWPLEMRLGLVWGYRDAFGVESGPECWGGGRGDPPPFKRFRGGGAGAGVVGVAVCVCVCVCVCGRRLGAGGSFGGPFLFFLSFFPFRTPSPPCPAPGPDTEQ